MTTWERKKARMKAREGIAERIRSRAGIDRQKKRMLTRLRLKRARALLYGKFYYAGYRSEELARMLDETLGKSA